LEKGVESSGVHADELQLVLRRLHVAGTIWFVVCAAGVIVAGLRQAGVHWWVLFSLGGPGIVLLFVLISLYLFAIFRGISSSQTVQLEHPLTSTIYYHFLYVTSPFLGGLAGCLGMAGAPTAGQFIVGIGLGTLATTFLVWVVVDPILGVMETVLYGPARRHRAERIAQMRRLRLEKQRQREQLLSGVLAQAEADRARWRQVLRRDAENLAALLTTEGWDWEHAEQQAIQIGAKAWQLGGISCMRELHAMVLQLCGDKQRPFVDYLAFWWDGIGTWQSPSFGEAVKMLT